MKQLKPLIITAIALVVLAVAVFGLYKLFPAISDEPGSSSPSHSTSNLSKIVDRSSSEVKSVEISTDEGENFAIDYSKGSDGMQTAALRGGDPKLTYNMADLLTLSGYVSLLVPVEEIPEGGEDSLFGFDAPRRTIKVTFTDGEKITLIIGNDTPLGSGVYIKRSDRKNVYTVGRTTADVLMATLSDYRSFILFSPPETSDMLQTVSLERPGKKTIALTRKKDAGTNDENVAAKITSDYLITSPVTSDASTDTLYSSFLDRIIEIRAQSIVEDHPKDLKKYGLDNPSRLRFTTTDGMEVSILIGDRASSGGRYVMNEGIPSVLVTEADIGFMSISHSDIIMRLVWFHNSSDISRIDYELPGGEKHSFKLRLTPDALEGSYDGKDLGADNATNLYLRTVRFTLQGEFQDGTKYGESAVKITATLKNGRTSTLELAKMNERQFAAIIDGRKPEFFVGIDEVNELLEAFEIIKKGEKIPDMFYSVTQNDA